ncbi:MAG: hypothetical protein ACE5IY_05425 [bacterium]
MAGKRSSFTPLLVVLVLHLMPTVPAHAQWNWNSRASVRDDGIFMGGAGLAFIGDESFYVVNLRTELTLGQWGLGVDIPLRFNTSSGELRDEDWDTTYDYVRVLRYLRYGTKRRTPVYGRLGTLDGARLGHGFIMNYYTNEAEYDNRKIGSEFDLKFKQWGVETVVSNYDRLEIIGGRAYVLPLREMASALLFRKLTFGATLVTDRDPDETGATDDDVTIAGVDVELPLLNTGPFFSSLYAEHAKIFDFGSGSAVGVELGLWRLGGLLSLQAKLERRFLGKEFFPTYFDPFYEVEKFRISDSVAVRKTDLLALRTTSERGVYGEFFAYFLNIVKMIGTFERVDGHADSGRLHVAALLSKSLPRISARAVYDKTGIEDFSDAFTLNERSILRAGLGYQINAYLYLFTDYIWTFRRNEITGELETQRRVEPQLTFVLPLNFGGN